MYALSSMNGSLRKDQLICPIPDRMMASGPCTTRSIHKLYARNHSYAVAGNEGEPSYEILDILLNKSQYGDQTSVKNSHPYFYGSPPNRSDNPLVRDTQFIRKGVPSSPVNLSQNTSCGASYGAKPLVRVEGFASKNQDARCNLSALA